LLLDGFDGYPNPFGVHVLAELDAPKRGCVAALATERERWSGEKLEVATGRMAPLADVAMAVHDQRRPDSRESLDEALRIVETHADFGRGSAAYPMGQRDHVVMEEHDTVPSVTPRSRLA
jgi:hypothetical protein